MDGFAHPQVDLDWVRQQYRYETLTWPELDATVAMNKVVLLPIGSIEQHGHHLPVDVDVLLATEVCLAAGRAADLCRFGNDLGDVLGRVLGMGRPRGGGRQQQGCGERETERPDVS